MKCKSCGASLDPTMSACGCGAAVELGRLTGILGVVCRACDAYNEPGARTCAACGKPLSAAEPDAPAPTPAPSPPPAPSIQPPAPPGAPVLRSFAREGGGAATRVIPSVLRASGGKLSTEQPALTPVPLVATCPRCGAETGAGRFCAQCGQALAGARGGTQLMMKPAVPVRADGPLAQGRAVLVLEAGGGVEGPTFPLEAEVVEAGRSRGAVTFPDDRCLAPHHATFFYRGGALHVRDEGAPGGVFLRLRGVSVALRAGDQFAIGERLFRYAGPLPPAPPPPPDGTRRHGSPRPLPPAVVLEEWLEGGAAGRVFVRGGRAVSLGRSGCAVNLGDDPHVSQAHAELLLDAAGNARLKDLGSANGTYLRLPPHAERELHDADRVRLGRQVLRVVVH